MDYDILRWEAPEFEYKEKGSDWYWILGVVAVFGALIAIILGNILFAVFIGMGAFLVGIYASKPPETLQIELNRKGIHINDVFYPHRSIKSFWVEDLEEGRERLLLTPKTALALQVVIPVENIDPDLVREFMEEFVEEEEQAESLVEKLIEFFHF